MPYELRLSPGTQAAIKTYVRERFKKGQHATAVDAIYDALKKLAESPHTVRQPYWAVRPFYVFTIKLDDGVTRPIRVTFRYDEDEKGILILEFAPQQM